MSMKGNNSVMIWQKMTFININVHIQNPVKIQQLVLKILIEINQELCN